MVLLKKNVLFDKVADRHDNIVKLRNENRDLEEKLREALGSAHHRGDVVKQMRDEIKQYQARVSSNLVKSSESLNTKMNAAIKLKALKSFSHSSYI